MDVRYWPKADITSCIGTAAGTHEITGIKGANTGPLGLNPEGLTVFNNEVLFRGVDANGQIGLWVTNGTSKGTHEITGISGGYTGSGGLNPQDLTAATLQLVGAPTDYLAASHHYLFG